MTVARAVVLKSVIYSPCPLLFQSQNYTNKYKNTTHFPLFSTMQYLKQSKTVDLFTFTKVFLWAYLFRTYTRNFSVSENFAYELN